MKFCPNCGKKTENDAKFCTNCGYNFTKRDNINHSNDNSTNQKQITRKVENKNRSHKFVWIIGVMVILCIVSGGGFLFKNKSQSVSSANETTTESADAKISSNTTNGSTTAQNSNSNDTSNNAFDKLSSDIGPKETAMAIAYYAEKSGLDGWNTSVNDNNGATIDITNSPMVLRAVSEKGQGMVYKIVNIEKETADDAETAYTLDSNDTVNIYNLADFGSDTQDLSTAAPISPLKSVPKEEIIQYINDHGYASKVKKLASKSCVLKE